MVGDMFGDVGSDKNLENSESEHVWWHNPDTASNLQQDFRMPQASWATQWTGFLLGNETRSLHKQCCRDQTYNCGSYCSTAAFSKWPFYPQSMFFWHNEEKRAIAAHTCSYYNHHLYSTGKHLHETHTAAVRWDVSSQETGHGCAEFGRMPSNPLSSPLLSLASPFLHQFLQSSPQNREWLVCLTETIGVIIQCIKALS